MPLTSELGIDLGTVNVLDLSTRRGIVLQEPSVVAQEVDTGRVVAVWGRSPRDDGPFSRNHSGA
jgi:rod shape-determining protein MreB